MKIICSSYRFFFQVCFPCALIIFGLQSCGGGSGGTGVKAFEGTVRTLDQKPFKDARLTIEETGDSSTSDSDGNFLLYSKAFGPRVKFLFETNTFSTSFTLTDISEESSRIQMGVVIDPVQESVRITKFSVKVRMIAECKPSFSNGEIIEQIAELPVGETLCTLDIRVFGDGLLRRKVPIVLQHSACSPEAIWITEAQTETGDGSQRGIAKLDFLFSPSKESCRYRILAPFQYRGFGSIAYPVRTLLEKEELQSKTMESP